AAAAALMNAGFVSEGLRDRRQSDALSELARALGSTHRLGEVLHLGLRHSASILGAEGAAVALRNSDFLHVLAASGCVAPAQGMFIPIAESVMGQAMLDQRTVLLNDVVSAPG